MLFSLLLSSSGSRILKLEGGAEVRITLVKTKKKEKGPYLSKYYLYNSTLGNKTATEGAIVYFSPPPLVELPLVIVGASPIFGAKNWGGFSPTKLPP